jgi:tetratricopeptide (TPR) repeat protein
MEGNICFIPVSIGELFDKYTILQIKQKQVKDAKKLEIVEKELSYLKQFISTYNLEESLVNELKETNEKLWVIEDKIREKEKEHKFDEEFVKLARNVYITNDKRSEIKNKINLKLKSGIQEVKSYSKYTDNDVETININTKVEEQKPIKVEEQKPILNKSVTKSKPKSTSEQFEELTREINKLKNTLKYDELIDNYKKIIELDSQNENKYLHNMGEVFEKQQNYESAVNCYDKILKKETTDASVIGVINNQIGMCYFNLKKSQLAVGYFKNVLLIKEIPDVFCNISTCYVDLKKFKLAENALLKSYNLDNTHKNTLYLLANLYYYLKNYSKSIDFYKKALSNKEHINNSDVLLYNFALSMTYLAKKDFSNGFTLYEKRLLTNDINKQTGKLDRLEIPQVELWDGKEICDNLLVVYEQGIGDNIQFYRFLIILAEKYPKMEIHYFTRDNLTHLFTTPHKNIKIIENILTLSYDYKVYIMTIPKILNLTNIEPNKINYIKMNEEKLLYWKGKTEPLKKFRVGFVYNGLLSSFIEKYIPLEEFGILCDLNIDLICIHRKSEVENDFKNISFGDKITQYDIDVDKPFEDTVHLLKNIDLLITVDTYIVHLAGVLNVKTWLLLGTHDWRWSNDENKTYWYNSVELIRTKQYEEFKDNIKTVKTKLSELLEILGSQ